MVPMDCFYTIFLYPITFILSPFLANHITSCLGFCVDMVSNLDLVSMIFTLSLFNNYIAASTKCLCDTAINNVYGNHDGFCIGSALIRARLILARFHIYTPHKSMTSKIYSKQSQYQVTQLNN